MQVDCDNEGGREEGREGGREEHVSSQVKRE